MSTATLLVWHDVDRSKRELQLLLVAFRAVLGAEWHNQVSSPGCLEVVLLLLAVTLPTLSLLFMFAVAPASARQPLLVVYY